jgi:crossover junction endodeoxyribonuclease RuvC
VRILGIDPGLQVTGFGVIDQQGPRIAYVASGRVRSGRGELAARLKVLLDGFAEVIAAHAPQVAVVEKVFVNDNTQTTHALGQARGAAVCAAVLAGLPVIRRSFPPCRTSAFSHTRDPSRPPRTPGRRE